jgi:hypothetical protein
VSVVVGFLYISISIVISFLMISKSRKLIWLLVSCVGLKRMYSIHTISQMVWVNFGDVKDNKNVVYVSGVVYYILRFQEMLKEYIFVVL